MRFDAWLSGAVLALSSAVTIFAFAEWEEWINLLIGCWILASPWALNFRHTTAADISIVVGAVVIYLSLLELWYIHFSFNPSRASQRN